MTGIPRQHAAWWQRRLPISPIMFWLVLLYPLTRWASYWWLPAGLSIFLAGFMLVAAIPLAILSYTLLRRIRLHIAWPLAIILFIVSTVVGWYAPHFSQAYAQRISSRFIEELDITVAETSQTVRITTSIDIADSRYVQTFYRLLTPLDVVEQELRSRLGKDSGWSIQERNSPHALYALRAYCRPSISRKYTFSENYIWLANDGRLEIWLTIPIPLECLLW